MRKIRSKTIKKYAVLSLAAILFTANITLADQTWDEFTQQANSPDTAGNMQIQNDLTTSGTALNLGAPPVPGGFVINGNNHTITAGATADPTNNPSFIINNQPTAQTTVNNTNFTGGNIVGNGAAIQNDNASLTVNGSEDQKSTFTANTTQGSGGAISNTNGGVVVLNNTEFRNNNANGAGGSEGYGGAIYNNSNAAENAASLVITGSNFISNNANNYGGAIANYAGNVEIDSSYFSQNHTVAGDGGAIVNRNGMHITNSQFVSNTSQRSGGAIINGLSVSGIDPQNAVLNIENTDFSNNYAVTAGGAIFNSGNVVQDGETYTNVVNIGQGTTFNDNGYSTDGRVTSSGGAILNNYKSTAGDEYTDPILNIAGSADNKVQFNNNIAGRGGAITNYGEANISNAVFNGNGKNENVAGSQTTMGGAIYNESVAAQQSKGSLTVTNTDFINNTANTGGAIYNLSDAKITDSNFIGNKANTELDGGAIYGGSGSNTTIVAKNKDVFIGNENSLANGMDTIYLFGSGSGVDEKATGNFLASENRTININSSVSGSSIDNSEVVINKADSDGTSYTGKVSVNGDAKIQNTTISLYDGELAFAHDRNLDASNRLNLYGGTLNLLNNEFGTNQLRAQELNLLGNTNIMLDVDLKNEKMDSILKDNFGSITNGDADNKYTLNVSQMKSVSEAKGDSARILFTDAPELIGHVTSNGSKIIEAPINKYSVRQETINNSVGMGGSAADNGEYFVFDKIGNSDSIVSGPVAAQAAFLLQDNLYRQSFANMDMVTLMTPEQRMAWKMKNKYANAGYHTGVYAPNIIPEERDGWYMRPFTNFENVPLKGGPKVSNVSYGTLIGGESDLVDLGHGWDGNFSFFGAYHGSHQAYNGVSIWQNGGTFGGVATAYKGNFWTGVTANIGASAAESHHAFGNDQFPILMTGAAWKSGYNWGLFNNKFIVQPSYMMSYTFVNVFDYTNAAGVKVTQDPLNAIEIIPGIRLIGNLKNGWQPYLGVNMTWNIMDKTRFYANDVALAQLSVKPYIEYGVGLQKRYGDRFTGFGQAMLRNGGRNGIAFTLGFRWALGN